MIYIAIAVLAAGLAAWVAGNYKNLVGLKKSVDSARGKLESELGRRHAAVGKFIDSLAEELARQPDLTDSLRQSVAEAAQGAKLPLPERESLENKLGDSLGRLLQALQKDEKLAESASYSQLRDEVLDIEDAVTLAAKDYNDPVARLNYKSRMFPVSLLATKLGITGGDEVDIEDVFARYPLQIKATMPTKRRSILFGEAAAQQSKEESVQNND